MWTWQAEEPCKFSLPPFLAPSLSFSHRAVINKSIPPINPLDPERSHMYIYNNIFFSFALDSRDTYKDIGGDNIAHVGANNDLKGVKLYNLAVRLWVKLYATKILTLLQDVEGLHTVLTAIIDYRGHRVVAQSIIPGILTNEKVSQVVYLFHSDFIATSFTFSRYGSLDNGKNISADEKFHSLMVKAGKLLQIGEHPVKKNEAGDPINLAVAVDSKGIIGTDGRMYILSLQLFPSFCLIVRTHFGSYPTNSTRSKFQFTLGRHVYLAI